MKIINRIVQFLNPTMQDLNEPKIVPITLYDLGKVGKCSRCQKDKQLFSVDKKGCGTNTMVTANWTYRDMCLKCYEWHFNKWQKVIIQKI